MRDYTDTLGLISYSWWCWLRMIACTNIDRLDGIIRVNMLRLCDLNYRINYLKNLPLFIIIEQYKKFSNFLNLNYNDYAQLSNSLTNK